MLFFNQTILDFIDKRNRKTFQAIHSSLPKYSWKLPGKTQSKEDCYFQWLPFIFGSTVYWVPKWLAVCRPNAMLNHLDWSFDIYNLDKATTGFWWMITVKTLLSYWNNVSWGYWSVIISTLKIQITHIYCNSASFTPVGLKLVRLP